jgi:DNA-binding transcriptional MerR regulator
LRDRGVDLSSTALEYYRHRGVLPRPIRRRYEGLTQALYPHWFIPVIERLKEMQAQGQSLDEIRDAIGPVMKAWALSTVQWKDPLHEPLAALDVAVREYIAVLQQSWEHGDEIRMVRMTFFDAEAEELPDFKHEVSARID